MNGASADKAVQETERHGTAYRPADIGQPIAGIIAAPAGNIALVELVQPANEGEGNEHAQHDQEPTGVMGTQEEEKRSEQPASTEKIPEMRDFIEAGDRRQIAGISTDG